MSRKVVPMTYRAPATLSLRDVERALGEKAPTWELGEHAAAVYAALDKLGIRALVPYDNYKRVKEGRWP